MVRIAFQRNKCIGCGSCNEVAPSRWVMNEKDGKSILLESKPSKSFFHLTVGDEEFNENIEAAELCPVNIIRVEKVKSV
ncbi:MAG: ferredoxin [Chlorobi bacterium]|nr:ferredoxin [Chlorobiota bacterium]